MKLIEKKSLNEDQKIRITEIWNNEYPITLAFSDSSGFDNYLSALSQTDHYILEDEEHKIMAWACKFTRENEKWLVIILDEKIHGKGHGTEILNVLKKNETHLNGWVVDNEIYKKINGDMYKSPLNFYLKNSFKTSPEIRTKNEKLSALKITWEK
jgi:hypothetical protein